MSNRPHPTTATSSIYAAFAVALGIAPCSGTARVHQPWANDHVVAVSSGGEVRHVATGPGVAASPKLEDEILGFASLPNGWNGAAAPAPSAMSIEIATRLCHAIAARELVINRVAPSAVGGVGITLRRPSHYVYLEVYNDGKAMMLREKEGVADEVVEPFGTDKDGLRAMTSLLEEFLADTGGVT